MKTCDRIRDLIVTDYIDGEAALEVRQAVESHLRACSGCRDFLAAVRDDLTAPLRAAPRQEVPDRIWSSIQEKIETQTDVVADALGFWEKIKSLFVRPAFVMPAVAFALFIFVGSVVFRHHQVRLAQEKEQSVYLAYMFTSESFIAETRGSFEDSAIEAYFL